MAYQVKIEKMIRKPVSDVFSAIREGRLFINCSADSNSLKIDFRVGGKYRVEFKNHGVANWGEFLEIIPNKKLVFTWCQTFGVDQKPDTQVTIELFDDGPKTRMVLVHDGFKDKATCDDHYKGWNGGIDDLTDEMENGRLRMLRIFAVPVETLYDVLKTSVNDGSSKNSRVTMILKPKGTGSSLELIHEGLMTKEDQIAQRQDWDKVTVKMSESLAQRG